MPKYLIEVQLEEYLRYVAECSSEEEAEERGRVDFREGVLPDARLTITVEEVPDDTPEGDL